MSSLVSKYTVLNQIGKGCSSIVSLCKEESTGLEFAYKAIDHAEYPYPEKILRECTLLKKLSHPNILRFIDVIEETAKTVIITEYVKDSIELFDFIVDAPKPAEKKEILKIFRQIISALKYMHDLDIAHRDIKLENILINPKTGDIKLIDFGFVKALPKTVTYHTSLGTISYKTPESFKDSMWDPKACDVWALGVTLFALATKALPFKNKNLRILIQAIVYTDYKIPSTVDPEIRDLINSMLVIDPYQRATINEIHSKINPQNEDAELKE